MIQRTMHVIAVPDLARSAAYYRDVLGFTVHELGDGGWRMYVQGACRVMAGECRDALPPADTGDHSYFAYLVVDDIAARYQELCNKQIDVIKQLRDEPWGMREFGLRTADGHRIMIGQEISQDAGTV